MRETFAPIKANITELTTSGATKFMSKSCFLRFKILVVIVLTEFTKSPLTLAISKANSAMFRVGTRATAEPSPAIANMEDKIVVIKKYIKYSTIKRKDY